MFLRFLLSLLLILFLIPCIYPQIQVFYEISCELDVNGKILKGKEIIQFTNNSSTSFKELYLNLTLNAFSSPSTSFFKESILLGDFEKFCLKNFGGIDILSIKFGDKEIKESLNFMSPDDGNKEDRTLAILNLPSPILQGQTVSLEIEFLNRIHENTNFFLFSNWYPKLSAIEEKEGRFVWNSHQFHYLSFPNFNFASYKVEITVPRNFRIGATGSKVLEKKIGKKKTVRFFAEGVNDFAWVTSPAFLEYKDAFIPERDFSLHELKELKRLDDSEETKKKIEISLLIRPERKLYKERYFKAIKEAIRFYWLNFSKYPYSSITFVDFPRLNEKNKFLSPNLILGNHPFFSPEDSLNLERIISKGLGEQYWRNIVSSDGTSESWLGEGLSSFFEDLLLEEAFNEPVIYKYLSFVPIPYFEPLDLPLFGFYFIKTRERVETPLILDYFKSAKLDPLSRKSWEFASFDSYRVNTKIKPPLILLTLEKYFGRNRLLTFLRDYFKKYAFRKPDIKDFLDMMEAEMGKDARRLFEFFLFRREPIDFSVAEVKNLELKEEGGKTFLSSVLIEKKGDLVFPVDVEILFEKGGKVIERWDGEGNWKKFVYSSEKKIEKVVVDPHEKFLLDANRLNNSFFLRRNKNLFFKAFTLWHALIEEFFQNLSFFI